MINILVCIKQVPDMESRFKINATGTWYEDTDLAWRMNEYDEYAVEQAVQLKEQVGEAELTVLCIGPERVKETMKKALAMGADKGMHILDSDSHQRDPMIIAAVIADYARQHSFDLLFTGMQSQDRGSAQVGVLVAEMLGIPSLTTLVEFSYADGTISAKRELEGGSRALVSCNTPALVTCQLGLNKPRYPTLPNIMKAKKKELLTVPLAEFSPPEAQQQTVAISFPEKRGGGLTLEGDPAELADQLLKIIKDKTTVLA
jgi:electron transfer flavoprotein beta subunit